jgi:hypothetical protein
MRDAVLGSETDNRWMWLRIYYHVARKDSLLLDGIWPAMTELRSYDPKLQIYFQRDWIGGPHILLGINQRSEAWLTDIVEPAIRRYMCTNGDSQIDALSSYPAIAAALSKHEQIEAIDTSTWIEHGNIVREYQNPEGSFVTNDVVRMAYRSYLSTSSELSISWLQGVRDGSIDRFTLAIRILISLAWSADPQGLKAHVSYMSHAIGLFNGTKQGPELALRFSRYYERGQGATVRAIVSDDVKKLMSTEETIPNSTSYVKLLRDNLRYFADLTAIGHVQYHEMNSIIDRSPLWRAWQLTVSMAYRTLNQLGLTPIERFLAAYLVSRACEDIYGKSAMDLRDLINASDADADTLMGYLSSVRSQ